MTDATPHDRHLSPRTPRVWAILVCLLGVALLFFLISDRRVSFYDGGLPLSLALRVLHGDVPHRDFYYQYGPMQPYLFAALFRVFGLHMLPVTVVAMLIKSGVVLVSYAVVRRVSPAWAALFSGVMVGFLTMGGYPSAALDALLVVTAFVLACAGLFVALPAPRRAFGIGLLAGLAGFYRYEQGPMLLLLFLMMLGAGWMVRRMQRETAGYVRVAGIALGGYLLLTLPLFLFLAAHGAIRDFWTQCFTFARLYYRSARSLPFPLDPWHHPDRFVFYLPMLIPPVVLVRQAWHYRKDPASLANVRSALLFLLSVLALFYAIKGSIRVDFNQMLPGNLAVFLVLGILLGTVKASGARVLVVVASCVAFLSTVLNVKGPFRLAQKQHELAVQALHGRGSSADVPGWCTSGAPLVTPYCFSMDADHERAALYLLQRVQPGDRIYVGLSRHDKIYIGDNLTYLATATLPAVKWSNLDPDLETRADIQREMISALEEFHPAFVVESSQFVNSNEPNDSSKSSGVFLLDEYLKSSYQPVAVFGPVVVLQRRTVILP